VWRGSETLTVLMIIVYIVGNVEGGAGVQSEVVYADWSNAC